MQAPEIAKNEAERIRLLQQLAILDTQPEEVFDRITRIAAAITGAPIALVSLVDTDRQWFKAKVGLQASQTPRDVSFCGHSILGSEPFIIPNAPADPRFFDNPLVVGDPKVVFYCGVPLALPGDIRLGTLCVIDHEPREITAVQRDALADLAQMVVRELELRNLALTDPLTGASNRHMLTMLGERELERTRRTGRPMAVVTFDIDHFKQVNDKHGHDVGDNVLRAVAQACPRVMRAQDVLFRQGGDEFAALMVEVSLDEATAVAQRMCDEIAALELSVADGHIRVTASFGVAGFDGSDESLEELLARADAGLYAAKARGRNCVEVAPG